MIEIWNMTKYLNQSAELAWKFNDMPQVNLNLFIKCFINSSFESANISTELSILQVM